MLLFFIIGDVLGAGIYALVGKVAGEVGGAIWTAFAAALVLAVFTAFAYAELVTKYPQAAGAALYTHKAYRRPFLTFLVAFAVMCSGITSAATLSRAFGGNYMEAFVSVNTLLVALLFITVVALVNFRGISESVKLNMGMTAVEITGLVLIAIIGFAAFAQGDGDVGRAFEFKADTAVPLAIINGAGLAFFALIGFEDSVNVAEETQDPATAFPRALFAGLLIAGLIYLVITFVASMVVPTGTLAESDGPLLEVVRAGPLDIPERLFSAIALVALANGALINMIMASRLIYGMSRQGIVPAALGRVHHTRRTPYMAIAFTTLLCMALIATGNLATLADTTVLLLLAVFATVNVAVLVLRRDPVPHRHFVAPTFVPVIGAVVCVGMMFTKDAEIFLRAGILLVIGAAFWFVNRAVSERTETFDPAALEGD
jgi:amino acid transporter